MMRTLALAAVFALTACESQPVANTPTGPDVTEVEPSLSASAEESQSSCPEGPEITRREVLQGMNADLNGNGFVCDLNHGSELAPLIITIDDMAVRPGS